MTYRRPYNRTNFVSSYAPAAESPYGIGCITEAQVAKIDRITAAIERVELTDEQQVVIDNIHALHPCFLPFLDERYSEVSKQAAMGLISHLLHVMKMVGGVEYPPPSADEYPGLPKGFSRIIPTKFGGNCVNCKGEMQIGTDLAVEYAKWQKWCLKCAKTDPNAAAAALDALRESRKALAGLHLWDQQVYRINDSGAVEVRRGRRWFLRNTDIPFSESTKVTAEIASVYAAEHGYCINCGVNIGDGADRRSIAVGYGPVCADRYGWYFPTHDEAEAILAKRRANLMPA